MKYYFIILELGHYGNLTIKNNLAMNYILYLAKLQAFQKHFLPYAYIVVLYLLKRLSLISGFIQLFSSPYIALLYFSFPPTHSVCKPHSIFFFFFQKLLNSTNYSSSFLLNNYGIVNNMAY